jgi:hypothetical protein
MRGILPTSLRVVAGVFGFVFVYMSVFLYEDEREEIQNHLEDAWIKLRDRQGIAISKHVAFMQTVGEIMTRLLDRLFGDGYFSLRATTISLCLSMLSTIVCFIVWILYRLGPTAMFHAPGLNFLVGLVVFLVLLALSIQFPRVSKHPSSPLLAFMLFLIFWISITYRNAPDPLHVPISVTMYLAATLALIFSLSFACDVCFVAVTRWLLRKASKMASFFQILLTIGVNLAVALVLVISPIVLGNIAQSKLADKIPRRPLDLAGEAMAGFTFTTGVDVLVASAFILLAIIMLIHRLFWPIVARPIYALADLGLIGHRKLFGTVGLALLGLATGKPLELLLKLVDVFYKK